MPQQHVNKTQQKHFKLVFTNATSVIQGKINFYQNKAILENWVIFEEFRKKYNYVVILENNHRFGEYIAQYLKRKILVNTKQKLLVCGDFVAASMKFYLDHGGRKFPPLRKLLKEIMLAFRSVAIENSRSSNWSYVGANYPKNEEVGIINPVFLIDEMD
ncbi:4829_t:CDS:2 [Funneliformis mosseae]|uniref:4829_t:CDS:1 n=1 Tax=Funneliformis mosseae TaxID=27381 RepID=A0A9N9DDW5_FUNMO|nr:4829_t:CDS:2 [Funneliformis mosseae]